MSLDTARRAPVAKENALAAATAVGIYDMFHNKSVATQACLGSGKWLQAYYC